MTGQSKIAIFMLVPLFGALAQQTVLLATKIAGFPGSIPSTLIQIPRASIHSPLVGSAKHVGLCHLFRKLRRSYFMSVSVIVGGFWQFLIGPQPISDLFWSNAGLFSSHLLQIVSTLRMGGKSSFFGSENFSTPVLFLLFDGALRESVQVAVELWAAQPVGRLAARPLGRWAAGPLGRWAAGPIYDGCTSFLAIT